MSRWIEIVEAHRAKYGIGNYGIIPPSTYPDLAAQCGPEEIQEITDRLKKLIKAEKDIPEWDGDSLDEIIRARSLFEAILKEAGEIS